MDRLLTGKGRGVVFTLLTLFLFTGWSCTSETALLNRIPVNSVEVEVVDQNGDPIPGAQVQASNGRSSSTDDEGIATVRFGTVGLHSITVMADQHMPSNFMVTMPTDNGKTVTARLAEEMEIGTISFGSVNIYPMIFNYMFSSYGYSHEIEDYEEGESTTWRLHTEGSEEEQMTMSKAFLLENEEGQQWWRIEMRYPDEDNNYIAEILFSEDRTSILRYREKIGDNEPQEKPVSDGWYTKPVQLTEESIEGAVTETGVSVTVPMGTFTADLLTYGVAPEKNLNIWRAQDESVPGGVVKYETTEAEEIVYSSVLVDYSTDAQSILDSY